MPMLCCESCKKHYDTNRHLKCPYCGSPTPQSKPLEPDAPVQPVVGWLVVVNGIDTPKHFRLIDGMNRIGRDNPEMQISLTDPDVSRTNHAYIMYNGKHNTFKIKHDNGQKTTFLNNEETLEATAMNAFDRIEIGRTEILFIPFCGEHFSWTNRG